MERFSRIAVIGRGLIGGSIELALARRVPDSSVLTLDRGERLVGISDADLVILAAPVGANNRLLADIAPLIGRRALVTDVGSTKVSTVAAAAGLRFIGGHPVAGAAAGGRQAARADLFDGRPWILTPTTAADTNDVERLRRFVEALGARPVVMKAAEHDRIFAHVSHLPQLVVSALMDVVGRHGGIEAFAVAGAGLRDSTRLAGSPPDIWLDIVQQNGSNVRTALDAMIETLTRIRDDESGAALRETFERASLFRMHLEEQR